MIARHQDNIVSLLQLQVVRTGGPLDVTLDHEGVAEMKGFIVQPRTLEREKRVDQLELRSLGDERRARLSSEWHRAKGRFGLGYVGAVRIILVADDKGDAAQGLFNLPELASLAHAQQVAEKLQRLLSAPCRLQGCEVSLGASIGLACYPADARDAETLMRYADMAMYTAKDKGRGTWAAYAPHMSQALAEKNQLHDRLKQAMDRGGLELQFWLSDDPMQCQNSSVFFRADTPTEIYRDFCDRGIEAIRPSDAQGEDIRFHVRDPHGNLLMQTGFFQRNRQTKATKKHKNQRVRIGRRRCFCTTDAKQRKQQHRQ